MDSPGALCKGGCGFYGSSVTDGYCSLCYKEELRKNLHLQNRQSSNVASPSECKNENRTNRAYALDLSKNYGLNDSDVAESSSLNLTFGDVRINLNDIFNEELSNDEEPDNKEDTESSNARNKAENVASKTFKRNKCQVCKKRVGLTGFDCRCGGLFCGLHRYSDTHGCTFNYVTQAQKEKEKPKN
ncbi:hypothetical protein HELRODRAFT_194947 [Helobdella robusta]|uniref:AN1-type domain-containing protein n=1 Tax=Helobdella robusta TaxID=6412 RepID=T1FWL6_HELRO|nr:hypothetical protein HELRODRAFT_194947 [Helobdella robusta]ESO10340.1 hypothetical protein HELRODRAFT_194947 [Helobdella robusta]